MLKYAFYYSVSLLPVCCGVCIIYIHVHWSSRCQDLYIIIQSPLECSGAGWYLSAWLGMVGWTASNSTHTRTHTHICVGDKTISYIFTVWKYWEHYLLCNSSGIIGQIKCIGKAVYLYTTNIFLKLIKTLSLIYLNWSKYVIILQSYLRLSFLSNFQSNI